MEIFRLFGTILVEGNSDEALDNVETRGRAAQKRLGEIGKAAGALALSLGAIGIAAVGALGEKAVKVTDEFHKAMNGLAAQTGTTSDQMGEFEEIAKRLYSNGMGESFEDIAKTMSEIKQTTGQTGAELEKMSSSALLLRDTFDMDVAGSVNTVNSLMKQFGINGDQAYTLIAQGAQQGANKNGDLLDVMNEYGAQFSALGFSAEQFTDILIQGAKDGAFQVDKVGDAIKEFTIRSKDGSKGTNEAFKALGLNADQMGKSFAAGGQSAQTAFGQVMTALSNVADPMEKNAIGVSLFGTQFEDLEAKAITSLANVQQYTNMTADTLGQMNNIKYDSFGEAISGIGRMFETGVLLPLGEKILPKLGEFAAWFSSKMPEIEAIITTAMNKGSDLFNVFANAIQFVIDNANIFLPILAGVTAAIAAQAIINTIVTMYNAWKLATATQTTAQLLLNAAMSANPIGLVALAIGALIAAGVLLYQNWDTIKEKLGDLWDWMKKIGGNIKEFFGDVFSGLGDGFKWYVNKWVDVLNFLIRGLNRIKFDLPDWVPGLGGKSFGINISELPHFAKGTSYFSGGMAVVGEEGPEIVNLPRGSQVMTNSQSEQMLDRSEAPYEIHSHIYLDGEKIAEKVSIHQEKSKRRIGRGLGFS